MVDLPPPGLAARGAWSAGSQQIWRLGQCPGDTGHFRREHWPGIRGRHKRGLSGDNARVLSGPSQRYSVPFFQGVRRDLTKEEAIGALREYFSRYPVPSARGREIDSAFLHGKYDTWGETQLRTKIRSHRINGQKFYSEVFDKYINDDS